MTKTFHLSPVHDLLLRGSPDVPIGVFHLYMATADQLTRAHYKAGMIKTTKMRLKQLVDAGYLWADSMPTRRFRSPYYYMLTDKGIRYLTSIGLDIPKGYRVTKTEYSYLFVRHTLELGDLLIAASLLKRCDARYWLGESLHEHALEPLMAKSSPVVADAYLKFYVVRSDGRTFYRSVLLECDRGTEQKTHFQRRIAAYARFLRAGNYQQLFQVRSVIIAFTTSAGPARLQQMREWTRAYFGADTSLLPHFLFTSVEMPPDPAGLFLQPVWYDCLPNQAPVSLLAF